MVFKYEFNHLRHAYWAEHCACSTSLCCINYITVDRVILYMYKKVDRHLRHIFSMHVHVHVHMYTINTMYCTCLSQSKSENLVFGSVGQHTIVCRTPPPHHGEVDPWGGPYSRGEKNNWKTCNWIIF